MYFSSLASFSESKFCDAPKYQVVILHFWWKEWKMSVITIIIIIFIIIIIMGMNNDVTVLIRHSVRNSLVMTSHFTDTSRQHCWAWHCHCHSHHHHHHHYHSYHRHWNEHFVDTSVQYSLTITNILHCQDIVINITIIICISITSALQWL